MDAARQINATEGAIWRTAATKTTRLHSALMHYDAHQPIIAELEARILTIRDSL